MKKKLVMSILLVGLLLITSISTCLLVTAENNANENATNGLSLLFIRAGAKGVEINVKAGAIEYDETKTTGPLFKFCLFIVERGTYDISWKYYDCTGGEKTGSKNNVRIGFFIKCIDLSK